MKRGSRPERRPPTRLLKDTLACGGRTRTNPTVVTDAAADGILDGLTAALDYQERGFALIPIRPGTKLPHGALLTHVYGSRSWKRLQSKKASKDEIHEWFAFDAHSGLGLLTGVPSGLAVIDVDVDPIPFQHPVTPIVRTSRGCHLYFRRSQPTRTRVFPWGDLKADGSYVVAPPTVCRGGGGRYDWIISLDDAPLADLDQICLQRESVSKGSEHALLEDQSINTSSASTPGITYLYEVPETNEVPAVAPVPKRHEYGLAFDEAAVRQMAASLGISAPIGRAFRCVLPGHEEQSPSASLYRDPRTGLYVYRDWHRRTPGLAFLTLATVRAALGYNQVRRISRPEMKRWYLRLGYEAGLVEPLPIALPSPPSGTDATALKVAEGFMLLLGLRWLDELGEPTPFTQEFARAWCGVPSRTAAGEAIRELLRLGVIVKADEHHAGCRTLSLYLPGPGPRRFERERP